MGSKKNLIMLDIINAYIMDNAKAPLLTVIFIYSTLETLPVTGIRLHFQLYFLSFSLLILSLMYS